MSRTGYIPERITMVFSDAIKVNDINIVPVYPVDSGNKKRLETADNWAKQGNWRNKGQKTVQKIDYPNGPFTDVRINELELRGEGGRAYKVILGDDYYVDFREDELIWVIKNKGIREGGIMNGEFVFAVVGSQTKLIPVGSPIHSAMIEAGKLKFSKPLSAKEFIPSHRYKQKNGNIFTLIDFVQLPEYKIRTETNSNNRFLMKSVMEKISSKTKKHFLIFEKYSSSPREAFRDGSYFYFHVRKNISAIEDLGEIPISNMVTIADLKTMRCNHSNYNTSTNFFTPIPDFHLMQEYGKDYEFDPDWAEGKLLW